MSSTIPERAGGEEHYIGIDVGTGSARACIINSTGDIKAVASKDIQTWQPKPEYYEQSTSDIWNCISSCVRQVISEGSIDPSTVRGIGFCATCSLAVFAHDTNEPISVNGPRFDKPDQNVILWLDHRPVEEARKINGTHDSLLKYVGGKMSVEMEIPKILWLKNNMPKELFDRCKFYDLTDTLTYLATGRETRSFCSTVCKQGYVPVGVDGSEKGWKDKFFEAIGLQDIMKDNYIRLGGVNGVNGKYISAGELVGGLSKNAASEWGLPAGIAVGSGVIDAYAGWIGTVGAMHDLSSSSSNQATGPDDVSSAFGRLAAVAGTSTCHLAMSKDPIFVNGVWGPYRDVIIPHFWVAEGGQSATGELLKHILETHPAYSEAKSLSESRSQNIYDYLDSLLHEMAKKTDAPSVTYLGRHFFFYGDLFGNRSPIADPHMKGSIIGLTSNKGIESLALHYYGTMEFIALQTRHIIETMNDAGHRINGIYMSGSQCQNKILMSLIATVCAVEVVIPRYVTAAVCHGAAMLGAKAASGENGREGEDEEAKTEDLWSIMSRMSKPGEVVMPGKDDAERRLLDVKYKVFLEQARLQQAYRREVDEAVKGWGSSTK